MRVKGEALTDGEMRLYNAVFSRGSVRRYRMKPIPAKLMGEINEYLNSVSMLHADALQTARPQDFVDAARLRAIIDGLGGVRRFP